MVDQLRPPHPHDPLARGLEPRLPRGVVLAGELMVVPLRAVGLEDQPLLRPAEVGLDPLPADLDELADDRQLEAAGLRRSCTASSNSLRVGT